MIYQQVDGLSRPETERNHRKAVNLKGFLTDHKVKLFQMVLSNWSADDTATNEFPQDNPPAVQELCSLS